MRADRKAFVRAIGNLVRNGLKYARSEVRISATVERPGWLRLDVVDDGPGIPKESWDTIFEPFARLDSSRSRTTGGVGLGLAIAHRILEQYGGAIRVANAPGGGARLVTHWPLVPPGGEKLPGTATPSDAVRG